MKKLLFSVISLFLFFWFVSADGADMSNANILHYVKNNHLIIWWLNQTWSKELEIDIQDPDNHELISYKTVPMSDEKIDIPLDKKFISTYIWNNWELILNFIPKEEKGIDIRYDINLEFVNEEPIPIKGDWYVWWDQQQELDNWFTREKYNAYKFWYKYWLTTANSIENANMEWEITRAALAKMMANFAKSILQKTPDSKKSCTFNDVSTDLDWKYGKWISESCMLWIMWEWIRNFRPYDNVTRAEFSAVLSRLLFWTKDGSPYYTTHINALYSKNIITNTDPEKIEKRGNVLLMLMRAAINTVAYIEDKSVKDQDLSFKENGVPSATWDISVVDFDFDNIETVEDVVNATTEKWIFTFDVDVDKFDFTPTVNYSIERSKKDTSNMSDIELDNLKKSDLKNISAAILSYYTIHWMYPNFDWDNDASKKMINVSLLKDVLTKINNNYIIPTDPSWIKTFEWYKNTITNSSYWYYLMTVHTITQWWYVLLAKTKTEEGSNFLGSLYYMFDWDLKDLKKCESFRKSNSYWNSSCKASIDNGVCTYCNQEDLRYIVTF